MVSFVHGAENDAGTMGLQFIHRSDYPGSDYRKTAIVSVADSFRAYGTSDLHFVLDNAQDANPYTVGTDTRMVITNDGKVGIGTATPTYAFHVASEQNGGWLCYLDNGGATAPYGLRIGLNASDNNTTTRFIGCIDTTQYRFIVYSNGSVQNVDGTYGSSLSDERLKIDIKDANSQWADVKNINIINYKRLVDGEDSKSMLSVSGQQAREISPKLVGERPPEISEIEANPLFGTLYVEGDDIPEGKEIGDIKEIKEKVLFFKDSIFFWKCAKALQEAMAKIETLETKVTALENA